MSNKSRRSFLKNTALGTFGFSVAKKLSVDPKSKDSSELMCNPTTQDYYGEGPFYTENPPMIDNHLLASQSEEGERIIISGRIFNLDCTEFIPNAVVDVWHADNNGAYDNVGFGFRGFTLSNQQGFYLFETIKPGKYLNGNKFRPSHIHFKITPPGSSELITQLYFAGDEDIEDDSAASISSGSFDATDRIIPLEENSEGVLEGVFDIVVSGNGVPVGTKDLHLDKGMVYSANPNPFHNEIEIQYGVFKKSKVGLIVYNMNGQQVAILEDEMKAADKYFVTWRPEERLPDGHYFIALKINDLQVHYLKVIKA